MALLIEVFVYQLMQKNTLSFIYITKEGIAIFIKESHSPNACFLIINTEDGILT